MAGNAPDPALAARTQPAAFGQVDAFLTHSWSDDSALKWRQLQQWRAAFKAKHNGREPLVWIDKVDESLRSEDQPYLLVLFTITDLIFAC